MQTIRYSMDRHWRFTQSRQSVLPDMLNHETTYAFSKGDGAHGPATLNFDDSLWDEVTLPHDWQHNTPFDLTGIASHGYHPSGACWYRRTFLLSQEDENSEIQLCFDGISGISDLYFNGAKLLHNESCYNGFCLSLTDNANFGATPNVIAIKVDKTVWEGWWYEGCGINRHVWLIKRPRLHIVENGLWIKPQRKKNGRWQVDCAFTMHNAWPLNAEGELCAWLAAPDGSEAARLKLSVTLTGYEQCTAQAQFEVADPRLWDLDSPALYTLHAALTSSYGTDLAETRIGFRTISVDAQQGFWLNDRPVKLLGTCNHQDHAGIGAAIPRDLWRYRLTLLKAMGSNAYRCSHNPPPPELLDLCDEMGILVMDENRCFSSAPEALHLLRSMVRRDRNHPSVVMYSIFNEEPMQGTPKGRRLALHQMAELKRLDDTRPVLGAFNGGFFEPTGAGICLDITGINYFVDSYDSFHRKYPDQPMVATEIASAFATRGQCDTDPATQVFGNYDEDCALWGETARVANTAVLSRPFVMGMFVWTGFDYRGEPTPYEWPSVSSHFGIMDTCGYPKDVYYLYQAFWLKKPVLHLLPHWNHPTGKYIRVMAYTNCHEVELFLNGRSLGRRAGSAAEPPEWDVAFEAGVLMAQGYRDGVPAIQDERHTAGAPARLMLVSPMPCAYEDTDSVIPITVLATDDEGREHPTARSRVSFTVNGGILLGVGNGDPNNHDPDMANSCRLFNGRCQILVAAAPGAQALSIRATGRGLREHTLTLPINSRPFPQDIPATNIRVLEGWRISHTATHERPDPMLTTGASDMNSMEPITFTGAPQAVLDGHEGMYCLYQTRANLGVGETKRDLILNRVRGRVTVYIDGIRLLSKLCMVDERLELPVPAAYSGMCRVSIVIQNQAVDKRAGILDPIILISTPEGG